MTVSVPLLWPVKAVIRRLDIGATYNVDPPGDDYDEGYDKILGEPVIYRTSGTRTHPRQEMSAVEVECQIEMQRYEELRATFGGDDPVTNIALVFHRVELKALGLVDASTGDCLLKPGDRIQSIKKNGNVVRTFQKSLYIYELRPRSWGFGVDGYDLEIAYTSYRESSPNA
jgi:hypothetical protein